MSDEIITAKRTLVCDICGCRIPKGSRCRLVRDDTMPFFTYFEHLQCPSGPARAETVSHNTIQLVTKTMPVWSGAN